MPKKQTKKKKTFHPTSSPKAHTVDQSELKSAIKTDSIDLPSRMSFYLGLFFGFIVVHVVVVGLLAIVL